MSSSHTRDSIFKELRQQSLGWNLLYKTDAINRQGKTVGGVPEKMTEVVSQFVIENFDEFVTGIKKYYRENRSDLDYPDKPYRTASHEAGDDEKSVKEKEIAYTLFEVSEQRPNETHWAIGRVLDYEIPLKEHQSDSIGNIDLVSRNGDTLYILELKKPSSRESMLRCILEAYTYYLSIGSLNKFITSFDDEGTIKRVAIAPLIFKNRSRHGSPWRNIDKEEHGQLLKLIELIQKGTTKVKGVPVEIMCIETGDNDENPDISPGSVASWSINSVSL